MIVDGKAIAAEILANVKANISTLATPPRLTVFTCAPNFETQKFLALKQKRAQEVGVAVTVISLDPGIVTVEVIRQVQEALTETDGVIVQLPFPPSIDIAAVLSSIPPTYDVDALHYQGEDTTILPPVVGAIAAIARTHHIAWAGKNVVVVGQGRLVGAPATLYARGVGATVTVVEKNTTDQVTAIAEADILILGAGVPGLITKEMVKPGVVVFDAGTSEEGGMLVGDALPEVETVASLVTPVPGGIGPITIAVLLQNVLQLAIARSKEEGNVL